MSKLLAVRVVAAPDKFRGTAGASDIARAIAAAAEAAGWACDEVPLADGGEGQKYLGEKNEAIRAMSLVEGKPAAYVCENFSCKAPVTDLKQLGDLLKL